MATRAQELNTIGDLLVPVGATAIFKQEIPEEYVLNSLTIRGVSDSSNGLNNAFYSLVNTYQIMYFNDGYTSLTLESEKISNIFNDLVDLKVKIRGIDEYVTVQNWSMSAPFKTDTDGIYGIMGMLQLKSNKVRTQSTKDKMEEVNSRIYKRGN